MNRYQMEVAREVQKHGMTVSYWEDPEIVQVWKNGVPIAALLEDGTLDEYLDVLAAPGAEKAMQRLRRISGSVDEFLTLLDETEDYEIDLPGLPFVSVLKRSGAVILGCEDLGLFDGFRFYLIRDGKVLEKYPARKFRQAKQDFLEKVGGQW